MVPQNALIRLTLRAAILHLVVFAVVGCFRPAPPLEEDELTAEEVTHATQNQPENAPTATSTRQSTPTPTTVTAKPSPTPTPAPTPQRPNNLPLIMQIADQTANEDTQLSPISFRIFDFDDDVHCDDVQPSSSDSDAVKITLPAATQGGSKIFGDVTITGGETTECGIIIKTQFARDAPAKITLTLQDPTDQTQAGRSQFNITVKSTNTAPFMSQSGTTSVTINEDQASPENVELPRYSDATQRTGHALTLNILSQPTSGNLTWPNGYPNTPGTATYKPHLNKNGVDSFSFEVCDNDPGIRKCAPAQTVVINVLPTNDPPTMADIPDQTTTEGLAKFIEFQVDDIDGPLECKTPNLSFSIETRAGDNPDLIDPTTGVVWSGTWPLCSATIIPKNLKSGTTHLTFSYNDGNPLSTASKTFKLTVNGTNHKPEIKTALETISVNEDSNVLVSFEVDDIDYTTATAANYSCSASQLSYTSGNSSLVASSGRVTWGGTWPNCTGRIYPNPNAHGTVNMTFRVTDSEGAASDPESFQLTINPQNDPPTGAVVCDGNSSSDIVKADRTGSWSVNCTGASDVDNDALTYTLNLDAGSPFNNSASFSCPTTLTGATVSQNFSTSEYGTCKYKARACDGSNTCTALSTRFIEITSYQLNMTTLPKPSINSSCIVSTTATFAPSMNISSVAYSANLGLTGLAASTGTKSIATTSESVTFTATIPSTFHINSPPNKDTLGSTASASFAIQNGSFKSGTQGGNVAGNLISNTVSTSYSLERRLEKLSLKALGVFDAMNVSLDGLQTEYQTTNNICRRCTSSTYASISAGALHTCLIDTGVGKCWGRNDGQLGLANAFSAANYTYPMTSSTSATTNTTTGFTFLQVASGKDFTCALGTIDEIRCVGNSTHGQSGFSGSQRAFTTKVNLPSGFLPIGVAASKTGGHVCAITNKSDQTVLGKVHCWGLNNSGQLGTGNKTSSGASGTVYEIQTGSLTLRNEKISSVALGKSHSCAVQYQTASSTSQVYCWGSNAFGQLGTGNLVESTTPVSLGFNEDIVQVAAGDYHTCAITKGGDVYCWGDNSVGQLGIGSVTSQASPVKLNSISNVVQITAGANHTCALKDDSLVYCWGLGTSGQLGVGKVTTADQTAGEDCNPGLGIANITFCKQTPSRIEPVPSHFAVTLSAGENHTCIMTAESYVYCWGANAEGQLGTANKSQVSSPAYVCGGTTQCNSSGQLSSPRPRMCSRYTIP